MHAKTIDVTVQLAEAPAHFEMHIQLDKLHSPRYLIYLRTEITVYTRGNLASDMAQHFELQTPPHDTVFSITSCVTIDCPPSHAYHVLRDFSTWPAWNSFCPKVDVKSSTAQGKQYKLLVPGMKLTLHVRMDPKSPALRAQTEEVTEASEENAEGILRVSWSQATMPQFLLRSLRVNELHPGSDSASCEYRTWITMAGPTAYIVKKMFESTLQARFDDWSVDLKRYAEETWRKQVGSN